MFVHVADSNSDRTPTQIRDILNGARNFLKHVHDDASPDDRVEIDDGANSHLLFAACHDCQVYLGLNAPPAVAAYNLWFLATHFPESEVEADNAAQREIEARFPGIRSASLAEQKRLG